MSYIAGAALVKAFNTHAPKKETGFLSLKEQPKMDYNDPKVCPYCRKPMVRSTIRATSGVIEPVYVCHEDRAVGVVPDSEL